MHGLTTIPKPTVTPRRANRDLETGTGTKYWAYRRWVPQQPTMVPPLLCKRQLPVKVDVHAAPSGWIPAAAELSLRRLHPHFTLYVEVLADVVGFSKQRAQGDDGIVAGGPEAWCVLVVVQEHRVNRLERK